METNMAIIGSLMKTEMITARPEELVSDVAKRMRDNSVGAVLVIAGGRLEGDQGAGTDHRR